MHELTLAGIINVLAAWPQQGYFLFRRNTEDRIPENPLRSFERPQSHVNIEQEQNSMTQG